MIFSSDNFKEGMKFKIRDVEEFEDVLFELVKGTDGAWYGTDMRKYVAKYEDLDAQIMIMEFFAWDDIIYFVEVLEYGATEPIKSEHNEKAYDFIFRALGISDSFEDTSVRIGRETREDYWGDKEHHEALRRGVVKLYGEMEKHEIAGVVYKKEGS